MPIVVTEELSMLTDCDLPSKDMYIRTVRSTCSQLSDALVQVMSVSAQAAAENGTRWMGFEIKMGPVGDPPLTRLELFSKLLTKSVFTSTLEPPTTL